MKTLILKSSAFACVLLLVFTAFSATSCKKDSTCHGKIHVMDTAGLPVNNATVKLAAPSVQGDVVYEGSTDASGNVSFEVKLPAIFDVVATKSTYPGMAGVGVIRLDEPGKEVELKVTIQ